MMSSRRGRGAPMYSTLLPGDVSRTRRTRKPADPRSRTASPAGTGHDADAKLPCDAADVGGSAAGRFVKVDCPLMPVLWSLVWPRSWRSDERLEMGLGRAHQTCRLVSLTCSSSTCRVRWIGKGHATRCGVRVPSAVFKL